MSLVRKLKPDRNITGVFIPLSMLFIFGLSALVFGVTTGMYTLAVLLGLFALYYLYAFTRTGNAGQLVPAAEALFFVYMFVFIAQNNISPPFERVEFALAYFTGLGFFGLMLIYLLLTRKAKWRGREIFELAAESVDDTGDGYTSRPRPVGRVDYSPQQMRAFARFCGRHLIALPYTSAKNTTLVPLKMGDEFGRLLGLSGDYRDATWVNFDANGEVSVHVAQKDYLDYREPLAFDQLCTSLGQVFIDFFDLYNKGEGVRVIDRMDELKIAFFS
ncbi:MAG: hypothetical protein ACM3H7_03815 [Acidobacteriaceae bacterium]